MKTVTNESNNRHRLNEINLYTSQQIRGASQVAQVVENPATNAGNARDMCSIHGLGRAPGEGNGNLLQYSYLENPTDRGARWATDRVATYLLHTCRKELDMSERLCTHNKLEFLLSQSNGHGLSPEKSCF